MVRFHYLRNSPGHNHLAVVKPDRTIAEFLHHAGSVRYAEKTFTGMPKLPDPAKTLFLKCSIAHRENFVDQQQVGIDIDRDRECQSHRHAG